MIVAPFLAAVAVLGYLAGHHRVASPTPPAAAGSARLISVGSVLVEYPAGWSSASPAPSIPGLALADAATLAPHGDSSGGSLVIGRLPGGESAPLPDTLLARLGRPPRTEVVDLLGGQAYRYSEASIPGEIASVVLYVVPNPGAGPLVLGCLAPSMAAPVLHECERIVARVSLVGQAQYDLSPDAGYAHELGALMSGLDQRRLQLRREIRGETTAAALATSAAALSSSFAGAAARIAEIEPPLAAASAQATLAASVRSARDAYVALAAAAAQPQAAGAQVARAEAGVDGALADFALLGYIPSVGTSPAS
ncbi:MAG TPA: hypothetical protein VII01_16175 [Solirubrobacteraceae bacterium]